MHNSEIDKADKDLQRQFNTLAKEHGLDTALLNLISPEHTGAYLACRSQIPDHRRLALVKLIWERKEDCIKNLGTSTDLDDLKEYVLETHFLTDFDWDLINTGEQDEELLKNQFIQEVHEVLKCFDNNLDEVELEREYITSLLESIRAHGFENSEAAKLIDTYTANL